MTWEDSDTHREWVAKEMKSMKILKKTCDEVKQKQIGEWDVTNSCAALRVFVDPLPTYIKEVKDARNKFAHRANAEVQSDELYMIKRLVYELILGASSIIPKKICDGYQAELDNLANSELALLLAFCIVLSHYVSSAMQCLIITCFKSMHYNEM